MGKQYRDFDWEELAADAYFRQWVKQPTPESETFWRQWLAEHPERQSVARQARWVVSQVRFEESWTPVERQQIWRQIEQRMGTGHGPLIRPLYRRQWLWAATSLALTVLGFVYWQWANRLHATETAYGEVQRLKLDDGSVVTLNANSTVRFADDFLKKPVREVWVEGEAYFEVTKRVSQGHKVPFIVHADNLNIEVLGTAFNVTNRRGNVDVVLQHGSVKVADTQQAGTGVFLKPGEKATRSNARRELTKQTVDTRYYTSWTSNLLLFREKPLPEIAQILSDLYGLDVRIDNPDLARQTFTGSIRTDSVDTFFDKLKILYPVEVVRDDKVIHLK